MTLFPESSLSSDGPGGFVPCSQSTPGPWDRGDTGGDTEGVHSCPEVEVHHPPRGRGTTRCKPPQFWPLRGQGTPTPWLGGPALLKCVKIGGEEGGAIAAPPQADKGNRQGEVLFQLCSCFLGETLTLKLCATGEVTSVFKARIRRGGGGKAGGGGKEGAPFLCTEISIPTSAVGAAKPPRRGSPAISLCPFLLWYWPAWRDISMGRSPGEEEEEGRSERRPCPPSRVGGSGRTQRTRWGRGGAVLREGWDGLLFCFLLLSLPRGGSLADFLDQLLIGQAVEAVDGQVRDEVLTGFAGDLFATS